MDKVYLITSGEYSDYGVLGFFTDKKKAEKYCAIKNSSNKYWCDSCSVEECENLQNGFIASDIEVKYEHSFYVLNNGKFQQSYGGSAILSHGSNKIISNNGKYSEHIKDIIYIYLPEENIEKAGKIAQDMYAKYKAEQSGI